LIPLTGTNTLEQLTRKSKRGVYLPT